MTTKTTRRAVTLTEVLIAIFLMGIGLMAILSLFPLGAAQMAQALKDQRAAECAANAASFIRSVWKQACEVDAAANSGSARMFWNSTANQPRSPQRFVMALDDPNFNDLS